MSRKPTRSARKSEAAGKNNSAGGETITNAKKYSFPMLQTKHIFVGFVRIATKQVEINITANRVAVDYEGRVVSNVSSTATIAFTTQSEIDEWGGGQKGINDIANNVLGDAGINLRVDQ